MALDHELPLSSLTSADMDNDIEKGLSLESPTAPTSITLPPVPTSHDSIGPSTSTLMQSTGPGSDINLRDPIPLEPLKRIEPTAHNTWPPPSPDRRTLLQFPLMEGVSPDPAQKTVPQDPQSDIPMNLDQNMPFWKAYNEDADAQDKEIVESLGGDLDALLIFAGLFSASNVAFIVEAYKDLKQDNVDTTNDLLRTLIHNQVSPTDPITGESSPFTASARAIRVNALFFTSLSCSLLTALGAVLGKQWLNHYKREGRRMTLAERGRERQRKLMGLELWHLEHVVETLPTLLQLSLFLFLGALIDFLWPINRTIAGVLASFSIITFSFYATTTTLAAWFPSAPFQTRLSGLLRVIGPFSLRHLAWFSGLIKQRLTSDVSSTCTRQTSQKSSNISSLPSNRHTSTHPNQHAEVVTSTTSGGFTSEVTPSSVEDQLSLECISWLLTTSSVEKTLSVAATAALMLPEKIWTRIETLHQIPYVLRLVLRARESESEVILDAQPMTVKAVLEPLHALVMKWDRPGELIFPALNNNDSFAVAFEHLLWKVVRAFPVGGKNAVWILRMLVKLGVTVEPHWQDIDLLYRGILQVTELSHDARSMLAFLVLLEDSMGIASIMHLLKPSGPGDQYFTELRPLHESIILIDESGYSGVTHPSVRSFFSDSTRCQNTNFTTTSTFRHTRLALLCIRLMENYLKPKVLGADNGILLNKDISDLETRLKDAGILESVQYACRHWTTHLQFSSPRDLDLQRAIQTFCGIALLPWLEVMSLLDCYDQTISGVRHAETWAQVANLPEVTVTLLQDMARFVVLFKDPAKTSAAAIYSVALPLAYPSQLYESYHNKDGSEKILQTNHLNFWTSITRIIPLRVHEVTAISVSRDGRCILSGSKDGAVGLFAVSNSNSKQIATLKSDKEWVNQVRFSPDSKNIICASSEGTIKVWDANTYILRFKLEGHRGSIWAVNVSPDNKYIVSGASDRTVRLWDSRTGLNIATVEGHSDLVRVVMFSPDGLKILSASDDGMIFIWNTANQKLLEKLEHRSEVRSAIFSQDGKLIASGGSDGTVKIWNAESHTLDRTLEGPSNKVNHLEFSPDSRFVVASSEDRTIWVWNILNGSIQTILEGHVAWIGNVSFTPDQRHIVSSSDDATVRIWNWKDVDGGMIKPVSIHTSHVAAIAFSPDGKTMASGGDCGELHLWDVVNKVYLFGLKGPTRTMESISFSSDAKYVTASSSVLTTSWDLTTRQVDVSGPAFLPHSSSGQLIQHHTANSVACGSSAEYQLEFQSGSLYANQFIQGQKKKSKEILKLPFQNISASGVHGYHLAVGTHGGQIMILDFSSIISFEAIIFDKEASDELNV